MLSLKVSEVQVAENRQRKHFDPAALDILKQSIKDNGLLQPIVVRETAQGYYLVAGERRLRAVTALGLETITCVNLGDLDELSRERAELEENTVRQDLTWQERTAALARLHKLRGGEEAARGGVQTLKDTAVEVFGYAGAGAERVRHAVMLQDFAEDEDVKGAKSEAEAINVVRKKLASLFSDELAKRVKTDESPHLPILGDCKTVLPTLPTGMFDCIITDPPYGINADKMNPLSGSSAATMHEYRDDFESAFSVWVSIFKEGFRITKPDAALYMFLDFRWWEVIAHAAEEQGWTVWKTPLIWHKPTGGMIGDSTHGPRKSYECILFAYKGDKRTTGMFLDVIIENPVSALQHAAAKPPSLYANLLRRSCVPGANIIDPCCGSGTIFPAANSLMLRATGIEAVEQHFNVAKTRLSEGAHNA